MLRKAVPLGPGANFPCQTPPFWGVAAEDAWTGSPPTPPFPAVNGPGPGGLESEVCDVAWSVAARAARGGVASDGTGGYPGRRRWRTGRRAGPAGVGGDDDVREQAQ